MPGFFKTKYKEGYDPHDAAKYMKEKLSPFNINWVGLEQNSTALYSTQMNKNDTDKILGQIQKEFPEARDAISVDALALDAKPENLSRIFIDLHLISALYLHDLKEKREVYVNEATAELLFSTHQVPKQVGRIIGKKLDTTDKKVGLVNKATHKIGMDAIKEQDNNKSFRKK